MNTTVPVSVLVLTLNEAQNIARCLSALDWCNDIVVLDSYSQDGTIEKVSELGARVYQHTFDNFAAQRNWALDNVEWRHKWVLHLDADEVVTPELVQEIYAAVASERYDCYQIPSKLMWDDTWLRYSGMYPVYQVRLGKADTLRFTQAGHGQREADDAGRIGTLRRPYLHYVFSKGVDDWQERHRRYAADEAAQNLRELEQGPVDWPGLLAVSDMTRRRRALKQLSVRLPFRPAMRFLYMYVLRGGFLDGRKGWAYCRLLAGYEAQIVSNIRSLTIETGLPRRSAPRNDM